MVNRARSEMLPYRLIVLCPHEINIVPYATYSGPQWIISLCESGKVVRTKNFLPQGVVDPYMCEEIFDILNEYEEFYIGRAYAIVSNICLDHVDEKAAIYTFAPEPMKKAIRFEGGHARLRLIGSKKYPFRCYGYPPSGDEGRDNIFYLAGIEVRIPHKS